VSIRVKNILTGEGIPDKDNSPKNKMTGKGVSNHPDKKDNNLLIILKVDCVFQVS
jgi:hypothetical protein